MHFISAKLGTIILKNKYLKAKFEWLTINYFIPLLKSPNLLLNSLTCQLLALYLPHGDGSNISNETVGELMSLIYEKLISNGSLALKYNAILAFTALLDHAAALQAARPHFQTILEIYIKMLDLIDHESLLRCLESIVKNFSEEIITYAGDLT